MKECFARFFPLSNENEILKTFFDDDDEDERNFFEMSQKRKMKNLFKFSGFVNNQVVVDYVFGSIVILLQKDQLFRDLWPIL